MVFYKVDLAFREDTGRNSLSFPPSAITQWIHSMKRVGGALDLEVQNRIENRNWFLMIKMSHLHSHVSEKKQVC